LTKLGYKMTEIGEMPEEWKAKPLSEVATYINGMAFKPSEWRDSGIPIVRIENLNNINASFNYYQGKFDSRYLLYNGEILLSWSASLGVYIWNRGKALLNQHIFKVIPVENVSKQFLFWGLHKAVENLSQTTHGSTMKHFKKGQLEKTLIWLPPLPEQQKIAEILSTADDEIQKVNTQIALTEQLKKRLMQRLLTGGIGHTKFKMTEIGEIPEEWDFRKLEEVSILRKELVDPRNFTGKIYLGLEHLTPGDPKITSYGNPTDVTSSKWKFYSGDILYGKLRPYLDKVVVADRDGISSTDIYIIVSKNVQPNFLLYLLHTKRLIEYVTSASVGTNHPRISWEILKDFEIPFPPNEEQIRISEILITIDEKIVFLKDKKTMLETLKKGLMNDLITGKVRVKI